jgi:LmbE family N-acetylglucosaminyl deacetylase
VTTKFKPALTALCFMVACATIGAAIVLTGPAGDAHAAGQNLPDTVEAISRARVSTRILYVTAHPDDESSGILTYLSRGLNADVALLSVTRGEGGQNAIGPEQGPELAILRTQELLAATRGYGVGLFFTSAPDFGYSKTAEETLRIWDGGAIEDMVRVLRTFRPDVVINQWGGVHSGHGQHQATGILLPQAAEKAADPAAFANQIAEGLRPWRVGQVLEISRNSAPPAGAWLVPVNDISPLGGRTYGEIGLDAFSHHRSQGITEFLDAPFFRQPIYLRPANGGVVDPRSLARPLDALVDLDSDEKSPERSKIGAALAKADDALGDAHTEALALRWADAAKSIAKAGKEIVALQKDNCGNKSGDMPDGSASAAAGYCWALSQEHLKIDAALAGATAVEVEARAAQSELVAGQSADVTVREQFRDGVGIRASGVQLEAPPGWSVHPASGEKSAGTRKNTQDYTVAVPAGAAASTSPNDAIEPESAPLISARFSAELDGYLFAVKEPAMSFRKTSTSAELASLALVPAVTLTIEPAELMVPLSRMAAPGKPLTLLARVRCHGDGNVQVTTVMGAPDGWKVAPVAPLQFSGPGDQLVRFSLTPPAHVVAGAYELHPSASIGMQEFRTSVEALPTLPARLYAEPAHATVHVLGLKIPAGLHIGYIAADNDPVPAELRQLGVRLDLLDDAQLAFGDLSHYDAIAVGIRAYELRPELIRVNSRLLDYVKAGGTLLVQYQRDFAWNAQKLAPYPATMPRVTSRTTDENSPVRFLAPDSPLLNFPNRISTADFKGWVQERGLYYWGDFDTRYQPVLGFKDPGEDEVKSPLVWARDGKGVYIYTGISFFRQLPAGVPGAYRLFINLLSPSRADAGAQVPVAGPGKGPS